MVDAITSIRIRGFKCLDDVELRLSGGLTVLIGANGSGKSAIVEACQILSRLTGPNAVHELMNLHRFPHVIRQDGGTASFEVEIAARSDVRALSYVCTLRRDGPTCAFVGESLAHVIDGDWSPWAHAAQRTTHFADPHHWSRLNSTVEPAPLLSSVAETLSSIDVHMPFSVRPTWHVRERNERSALRESAPLRNAERLERGGDNLVSAFHELKNRSDWQETLDVVRLGLGDDIEDIRVSVDANSYGVLTVKRRAQKDAVPSSSLSDGTLAYLCIVAMLRLRPKRSLLVFDEPELHLHPRLLSTVMDLLQAEARMHPVLLATHSDRVLDLLENPAEQTVLTRLNDDDCTVLERPNAEALQRWLDGDGGFRGLGAVVAAGHESSVFIDKVETKR
jgi:energy-coupling factor transporter ATP-binding protein EcfA2